MRTASILAGIVLAGSIAAIAIPQTLTSTIEGHARAIDGDTLDLGGVRVRLAEIDAPELRQTCADRDGKPWMCGRASAEAVATMLRRDPNATCVGSINDHYGRVIAHCHNSEGDIGSRLVALGLAVVWPRYSTGRYEDRQEAAKSEHLGMWSGTFTLPWEWRHARRL